MWAIETRGLCKFYGVTQSLIDCDLQIASGCVFGLLGPNGAGKTTLLRTLLGFLKPTRGAGTIAGFDIQHDSLNARRQVAYLPAEAQLMRSMRGDRLLKWFSDLHPCGSRDSAKEVARRLDLDLSRRVMFMSTGMRQKLALSIVLGCQAPIVVLDEPTANLDPNVRQCVLKLILEIREQGRTVILSSHIFSDIDETCDQAAILKSGRVVGQTNVRQIQNTHWVSGTIPHETSGTEEQWKSRFESQPLLTSYFWDRSDMNGRRVGLQLSGDPQHWFSWVSEMELKDLRIERGGISAIYQRFHQAVDGTPEAQ